MQFISIVRSFHILWNNQDVLIEDDDESRIVMEKSAHSFWMIFSAIPFINGLGLIIVGFMRGVQNWFLEGLAYEVIWFLAFLFSAMNLSFEFFLSLGLNSIIVSMMRSIMIYFEDEKMDNPVYKHIENANPKASEINNALQGDNSANSKYVVNSINNLNAENDEESSSSNHIVVPELIPYRNLINDLKRSFNRKENILYGLINKNFSQTGLTYNRFKSAIDNTHQVFFALADATLNIINLAQSNSQRIEDKIKDNISHMEGILNQMDKLIEEFIINDEIDDFPDDEIDELFNNMDILIDSVKDYKY